MKASLHGIFVLGLLCGLTGCPAPQKPEESAASPTKKLILRGSNTIGEKLAPRLMAAYTNTHPDVYFDGEFKGTGYGLGALSTANCDIAAASRNVSSNELDLLKEGGVELNEYVIGFYAVAVVVNGENPVSKLGKDQIRDIFAGEVRNWKDVGGADQPIHLYIRNPVSGTYLGFQELAMNNQSYGHPQKALTSYAGILQSVAEDPAGIGYSSIPVDPISGVKPASIEGIEPTEANVREGKYPYARVLRLITSKAQESSEAKKFIDFALSAQGREIISKDGFVTP